MHSICMQSRTSGLALQWCLLVCVGGLCYFLPCSNPKAGCRFFTSAWCHLVALTTALLLLRATGMLCYLIRFVCVFYYYITETADIEHQTRRLVLPDLVYLSH